MGGSCPWCMARAGRRHCWGTVLCPLLLREQVEDGNLGLWRGVNGWVGGWVGGACWHASTCSCSLHCRPLPTTECVHTCPPAAAAAVFYSLRDAWPGGREAARLQAQLTALQAQAAALSVPNEYGALLQRQVGGPSRPWHAGCCCCCCRRHRRRQARLHQCSAAQGRQHLPVVDAACPLPPPRVSHPHLHPATTTTTTPLRLPTPHRPCRLGAGRGGAERHHQPRRHEVLLQPARKQAGALVCSGGGAVPGEAQQHLGQ